MSYQCSSHWVVGNSNNPMDDSKCDHQQVMSVDDAPKVVWVPMLVPVEALFPYWGYPQTLYDYGLNAQANAWPSLPISANGIPNEEETLENVQPSDDVPPAESCSASADQSDSFSEASTDVGDGDDIADDFEEEVPHASPQNSKQVNSIQASERPPMFVKLDRQQRVDQLRRVIDEYCALEFDSVDFTSQEALACRMLAILKSLSESTTFHEEHGRSREKRLFLLGLGQEDEDAIIDVVGRAQGCCEERSFRLAFEVLKEMAPRLRGKLSPAPTEMRSEEMEAMKQRRLEKPGQNGMSSEEMEAMKQRRLEKRQRQRQERRVQRADDRADRAAQRCQSASSGAAANCQALADMSAKRSKK